MAIFTLKANARKQGAIGVFYHVVKTIEANTLEEATAIFRSEYETWYVQEA
ncbi:hypothetical protein [Aeromonas phage JELG-KS1]|uniref:Uncharacterized protein n=1 Tax=Aeromonas phage JELG-KS1 TaxID=2951233 RepID=A0A9E7NNB2_9CAUD|nr:hypothetical protein [Aeromonas phage JELG-KS1]